MLDGGYCKKNKHGNDKEPKYLKINVNMEMMVSIITKALFWEFTNVFDWNYKELWRTLPHIMEHMVELDITMPPTHQVSYCMNPNYMVV